MTPTRPGLISSLPFDSQQSHVEPSENALLDTIRAHPSDDAPRLAYAAWLRARNNPHGELIELQCAIAQLTRLATNEASTQRAGLRARERELLIAFQQAWLGTPFNDSISWTFDRGFPNGRFGHEGFFATKYDDESFMCARFNPEGVAISAACGEPPTPETFQSLTEWFDDSDDRGPYEITFVSGGLKPRLSFTTTDEDGDRIDYKGTIFGTRIEVVFVSHISEADVPRGEETYNLFSVPSYDNRMAAR